MFVCILKDPVVRRASHTRPDERLSGGSSTLVPFLHTAPPASRLAVFAAWMWSWSSLPYSCHTRAPLTPSREIKHLILLQRVKGGGSGVFSAACPVSPLRPAAQFKAPL